MSNTNKKRILIKLRPADYYFFGGEETFENRRGVQNYLVRSNRLPQQTALLGILRHVLFYKNKHGFSSFNAQSVVVQDFGALHGLSHLFLEKNTEGKRDFLVPAPNVWLSMKDQQDKMVPIEIKVDTSKSNGQALRSRQEFSLPELYYEKPSEQGAVLKMWTAKDHNTHYWISLSNGTMVEENDLFKSSLHIGIDKQSRMSQVESADDEGFYKQEFFSLAADLSFAVVATVDEDLDISIFNTVMPFGGESRSVILKAEEMTDEFEKMLVINSAPFNYDDRIVLISDAYLTEEDHEKLNSICLLAIIDIIPFRHIHTPASAYTDKGRFWANMHHGKDKQLRYLIKRGSVLFPAYGNRDKTIELLGHEQYHNFQNIGYNIFHPNFSTIKS